MTIEISIPDTAPNLRPLITVFGVGGSGGNAVNNMMRSNLEGVDFLIANTDAQALHHSTCERKIQLGVNSTRGLGAGMRPDIGRRAAEEAIEEISEKLEGSHMLFIAAGMGGGTGTGAAPVIAKLAREKGILTVGVVTKPFHFEGTQRMKLADKGIEELQQYVDTLLIIPNQNLFRIANEKTTFADAFKMADDVLYAGVRGVTDLMVQPGLINLDFSDVKTVMSEMGKAMMGTGEASGEGRAVAAAEAAIANPLIDDVSLKGARGLIINITGGHDITLYEVDEAANRIKQEVDESANIIYGTTCDERLEGLIRVSIVATGIDASIIASPQPLENLNTPNLINNSVYQENSIENNAVSNNLFHESVHNQQLQDGQENLENKLDYSEQDKRIENIESNIDTLELKKDLKEESIDDTMEETKVEESMNENNQVFSVDENLEKLKEEEKFHDSSLSFNEKISETNEKDQLTNESNINTSVKRLSLFDTLNNNKKEENDQNLSISNDQDLKEEPVLETNHQFEESIDKGIEHEEETANTDTEHEYVPEEGMEDEFNQENDEELLDIPTFLRRQAN